MTASGDLDRARIRALHARELAHFSGMRPRTLAMLERARAHMPNGTPMSWMAVDNDLPVYIDRGSGPGFTDIDGFAYLDFNASDMAMFCGHANPAIVRAVRSRAERSTQFLLPTEASVEVAEELARRYPVPMWQFTLSATQANTEAIRLARAVTGREVVVLFQGHYHGHFEEGVVDLDGGRVAALERGLSKGVTGRVRIAQFNEVDLLRAALEPGDVALVLTEPAMTNRVHLLAPRPGWHEALRSLTREHGTLLALATGGTLFGNPLSAAAAKAALTEVLTPAAYEHTSALGAELADGIEAAIASSGLPWTTIRLGPRSGQWYGPEPRTGAQAFSLTDDELTRLLRVWLANRGVWEGLPGAGPTVPVPTVRSDVERYLQAYADLLVELTR
jgi:glutamate-1-semialdehyde 2,1-aminomutase